jgi:hypothetical protein
MVECFTGSQTRVKSVSTPLVFKGQFAAVETSLYECRAKTQRYRMVFIQRVGNPCRGASLCPRQPAIPRPIMLKD